MREGLAEQASVELEEPEQAGRACTEFSEPVPTLASRLVEAEAEGDLNLHETSLAWRRILSIEARRAAILHKRHHYSVRIDLHVAQFVIGCLSLSVRCLPGG